MRTVLDYVIERAARVGRDTVVHRARRMPGGEPVALKVAAPDLPPDRRGLVDERLRREAAVLSAVTHPALVPLLELIEVPVERGRLRRHGSEVPPPTAAGVVLPWAPLGSLADAIGSGPLEPAVVDAMAHQLAGALAALHAAGFVHGDVSPGNVLRVDHGSWWLADLGESRRTTAPHVRRRGTDGFVAPEVIAGHPVDRAADVFALGCVLAAAAGIQVTDAGTTGPARDHAPPLLLARSVRRATCPDPTRRPTAAELEQAFATDGSGPAARSAVARPPRPDLAAGAARPATGGSGLGAGSGTRAQRGPRRDGASAPRFVDPLVASRRGTITRDFDLPPASLPPPPAGSSGSSAWHGNRRIVASLATVVLVVVALAGALIVLSAAWPRSSPGPAAASDRAAAAADGDGREPAPPPCPGSSGDAPAGAVAVPADLDGAGCTVPVLWWPDRAEAERPDPSGARLRFALGRPGDQLVLGDWDGDGRDTPALYTPATGIVARFDGWARPGEPLAGAVTDEAPPSGIARVHRRLGADTIDVDLTPP